ncbi:MAG: polysaccharide deacetylase family protein [Erythrobacter sp.]
MLRLWTVLALNLMLGLLLGACATPSAQPAERPIDSTAKRIALSFDDVPRSPGAFLTTEKRAEMLRAALRKAGVKQAAFFVNPAQLAKRPEGTADIKAYVAEGHVIANHTASHPGLSETEASDYLADLDTAAAWLKGRAGYRPWFRYPFLDEGRSDKAKRDALRAGLNQRGLLNAYVTVDASDWFYEDAARKAMRDGRAIDRNALRDLYVESHVEAAEFYDGLARTAIGRSPIHVMLLHETDLAALYIGDLVKGLREAGWTIVAADEAYADPFGQYAATYDTPSAQGTLVEMVAWQRGLPAPRWYGRNDTRRADAEFRIRVLGEREISKD